MPFASSGGRWLALLTVGSLTACAIQHREVEVAELALAEVPPLSCPLVLVELRDSVGPRALPGPGGSVYELVGLPERIESQVRSWENQSSGNDAELELTLDLVRAYSERKGDRTYFHTVLIATTPEGERAVLRGGHRQMNWWGTEAEFARAVERSLDLTLLRLHEWLEARCEAPDEVPV